MLDLSVVIVNTNTRDLLRDCLTSIRQGTHGIQYEIIAVDNNSADSSAQMVRDQFPDAKLICNDRNLGFAISNNRGFAVSSGRYVLALNPDTIVLDNALTLMVQFMDRHPEAGACGCRLLNRDGSLQPSWANFPTLLSEILPKTAVNKIVPSGNRLQSQAVYDVDWVGGACLMVRRETMEQVGVFDERFSPIYSEETDWCYRIKQRGWRIYYLPQPEIVHLSGQTTERKRIWFAVQLQRSKYLFFRKHKGIAYANLYRILKGAICLGKWITCCLKLFLVGTSKAQLLETIEEEQQKLMFFIRPNAPAPQLRESELCDQS